MGAAFDAETLNERDSLLHGLAEAVGVIAADGDDGSSHDFSGKGSKATAISRVRSGMS